jgi:Putative beta-barrel porin-2, OmpL-like. bbp2/Carboxypeptidase regulatory-like domain
MNGNRGVLSVIRRLISYQRASSTIAKLGCKAHAMTAPISAALLLGLLAVPAFGQRADGYVGGMARDSATGNPVAEVRIVAHNVDKGTDLFTVTDTAGMYKFTNLEPGRYNVAATKNGFQEASATVNVEGQHLTRVDLPLEADATPANVDVPPTITKSNAEPLTDREKQLLERIDRLETRLAAMEAKDAAQTSANTKHDLATQPLNVSLNSTVATPAELAAPQQTTTAAAAATPNPAATAAAPDPVPALPQGLQPNEPTPGVDNQTPFAYADFSWLNGTGRGTPAFDTKFFTPEIRFDTNYVIDRNHPQDHSLGGSTEEFRSGEIQVEQASFGGDFHWNNVRGRVLTMFGEFATTTPRNDASVGVGQWNLQDAYRYFSEAWGGYHFNVNHGLNVDAGIFVSYIGLFSYYNFDNWTYQPSYVSSNTPWFFNGLRIQWFPTNKLKIEPWFINGWQSYNKYGKKPGLGGQILWRPAEWISLVFNNYGMGTDTLAPNFNPTTSRIHTDDSIEVRYFNHPDSGGLSKMAFSFTGDLGCEYGGGASCFKNTASGLKTSFAGWMLYNRFWFGKDKHAFTIGGGQMDNPGGYLTLLPPINGANAVSGSPYFTENFGQPFKMWDTTLTYNWMPKTWATWWAEIGYRHSDQPYWSGRGGITPPGGNTGSPANYVCTNGASSAALPSNSPSSPTGFTPSGSGFLADNVGGAVASSCTATFGTGWTSWFPDLVKDQATFGMGIMVRF